MPVSVQSAISVAYTPNGVTTQFGFNFKALSSDEVGVLDQDGDALSTGLYSVVINASEGGYVEFTAPPLLANYAQIYVVSVPELTQLADFGNAGPSFNPVSITQAFDRAAIRDLRQQLEIDRAVKMPFGEVGFQFPAAADRVGTYAAFDALGDFFPSSGTGADAGLRTDLAISTGAAQIGFIQSGTGAVARSLETKGRDIISVKDFGATGDGVTDDTAAINAAALATSALGGVLTFPLGTYLISDYITIRNGVRAVRGTGGTIDCAAASNAGILLQGRNVGLAANVTGCIVENLVIDMTGSTGIGIYGSNCIGCIIRGNRITGGDTAQAGIFIKAFDLGLEDARDNIIANNVVDGGANVTAAGIQITSEGTYSATGSTISNNTTYGWQYGVGIGSFSPKTNIDGHTGYGGERGISIQGSCDDTTVTGVKLFEFTGTGVHVVSSDRVRVSNCFASSTSVASGEAAFQAYFGSENCTFENCESYLPSSAGVGIDFHFYAGASVSGTKFVNCTARGVVNRSYFCVESAYKATGSIYGRSKSGVVEADATGDTVGAGFDRCTAIGTSAKPAFAFIQTTLTDLTVRALTSPFFRGCKSVGDAYNFHLLLAEETASNLSAMTLTEFDSPAGVSSAKFTLPRGTAHASVVGLSTEPSLNTISGTVVYSNSWVTFGGSSDLVVRKDASGRVYINGAIKSGTTTSGLIMFTLPVGFRPLREELFHVYSNLAVGQVRLQLDGDMEILAGISTNDVFFSVSFPTT